MNPLQRTLIEKAGHDQGFEHVLSSDETSVVLASALHSARAVISTQGTDGFLVEIASATHDLASELARAFPERTRDGKSLHFSDEASLARMLRRAASLAQALPHQPANNYEAEVGAALQALSSEDIRSTEIERLIRQRVGQQAFREAMIQYWNGACAVTGVSVLEVLRASHAKPWADCASDSERLDVFNGFLLCAHLDALFDRFLISFDHNGSLLMSSVITSEDRRILGLDQPMRLRWLTSMHHPYLQYHRGKFHLTATSTS